MSRRAKVVESPKQIVGGVEGYLQLWTERPPFGRAASEKSPATFIFTTDRPEILSITTASRHKLTASRTCTYVGAFEANGALLLALPVVLQRGDSADCRLTP